MRLPHAILAGIFAAVSAPAAACLPPPPGIPEPPPLTKEEKAKQIYTWSSDIVYGVVVNRMKHDRPPRFKVIHTYKGSLKPGQVIEVKPSFGFDAPPCSGLGSPPHHSKGSSGVIAFTGAPTMNFVSDGYLKTMFDAKWIVSARRSAAKSR